MSVLTLTVNGRPVSAPVESRTHLADFLREQLHLTGTHLGCEQGVCGACTISIDGIPQRSCIAFAIDCDGSDIRTIEGYENDPLMAELRETFSAHHALQCGFCTPGMLITAHDIVRRLGEITESRIREELSGNLCRCTGYVGIVNAIRSLVAGRVPASMTAAAAPVVVAEPIAAAAEATQPIVTAPPIAASDGHTSLTERIVVNATPEAVWNALADLRRVASCLPGAEITEIDGEQFAGVMRVALGPVRAAFSGRGKLTRDEAAREGSIEGQGRDAGSGSLARGTANFAVRPGQWPEETILEVRLTWRLSGVLAQFNRSGLVQAIARELADGFAVNLAASIAGAAPRRARPVGLLAILWRFITRRLIRPHAG